MEKILFIFPPTIDYDKFVNPPENVRTISKKDGIYGSLLTDIPLGILALSSYVKKDSDAETKLIDFNVILNKLDRFNFHSFNEFFRNYISDQWLDYSPTIIGISVLFTTAYKNMLDIARCCRAIFPEAMLIAGGGVPTNMYKDIFRDTDSFDALIYGEGEKALSGLVKASDKKEFLNSSPCCITKKKVENNLSFDFDFIEELDEIPINDYDILTLNDYRLDSPISTYPGLDSTGTYVTMMTSRGCPHRCTFCSSHSIHGRQVRLYSLDRIKADIEKVREKYGAETIIFMDDHFMNSKKRAYKIINILKNYNMMPFFSNSLTLYALDRPMLETLQSVGVKMLSLAVESGNAKVLKEVMHKPLNLKIVKRVVKDCRELGIDPYINIIIGIPGETKLDIAEAHIFLKTLCATWFFIHIAVPLVGSEMHKICVDKGYLKEGYLDGDFKKAVIETEDFTTDYIQKTAYYMNLDLNFVSNGEMRLGNYALALKYFQNTIKVKEDHAFAYYFAGECLKKMGQEEEYLVCKNMYNKIITESEFWRNYAAEFKLEPFDA